MSRHCQHSSTARTCAIFAYLILACSKCHEVFNHEASQSNHGACWSAAGDRADFLYSAFADVKMLQFNSSKLVPNIIRMTLSCICQKAKTVVVLVVCCSQRPELRWLPHGYRQPSVSDSIWSLPGAYRRILYLTLLSYYDYLLKNRFD
jgi:hypothetical protein